MLSSVGFRLVARENLEYFGRLVLGFQISALQFASGVSPCNVVGEFDLFLRDSSFSTSDFHLMRSLSMPLQVIVWHKYGTVLEKICSKGQRKLLSHKQYTWGPGTLLITARTATTTTTTNVPDAVYTSTVFPPSTTTAVDGASQCNKYHNTSHRNNNQGESCHWLQHNNYHTISNYNYS